MSSPCQQCCQIEIRNLNNDIESPEYIFDNYYHKSCYNYQNFAKQSYDNHQNNYEDSLFYNEQNNQDNDILSDETYANYHQEFSTKNSNQDQDKSQDGTNLQILSNDMTEEQQEQQNQIFVEQPYVEVSKGQCSQDEVQREGKLIKVEENVRSNDPIQQIWEDEEEQIEQNQPNVDVMQEQPIQVKETLRNGDPIPQIGQDGEEDEMKEMKKNEPNVGVMQAQIYQKIKRKQKDDTFLFQVMKQTPLEISLLQLRAFKNKIKKNLIKYILQRVHKQFNVKNIIFIFQELKKQKLKNAIDQQNQIDNILKAKKLTNYKILLQLFNEMNIENTNEFCIKQILYAFSLLYNEIETEYNYQNVSLLFKQICPKKLLYLQESMIFEDKINLKIPQDNNRDYFIRLYSTVQALYRNYFIYYIDNHLPSYLFLDYKQNKYPSLEYPSVLYRQVDIHIAFYLVDQLFLQNMG